MSKYVTIPVRKATKKRLNELKLYPRETYDELLNRLIAMASESQIRNAADGMKEGEHNERM